MENLLKFKLKIYARKRGSLILSQGKKEAAIGEVNNISDSVSEIEEVCQRLSVLKEEETFLMWTDVKGKNWLLDFCKINKNIEVKLQLVPEDFLRLPITKMHWTGLFKDFKDSVDTLRQMLDVKLLFNIK